MAKDLLQGDIGAHLRALSIPAATSYLLHTLYNVTDTFFAGTISTQSLAALSLSGPVFFLLLALASGMSSAVSAVAANAIGAKANNSSSIAFNALLYGATLSLVVTIVGLNSASILLGFLHASGELLEEALRYIQIILAGSVLFIGSMFVNALLNAQGDMTSLRNILMITSGLNVLFDYLAIHFHFGIMGIGVATIATECIALGYLSYKLYASRLLHGEVRLDFSLWWLLFKQGVPSSANMFFMSIGTFIVVYYVALFGESAVAAYGVGIKIEQLVLMPILGLSVAVLTLVAQNSGAEQFERVRHSVHAALRYAAYLSVAAIASLWLFAESIISLFSSDSNVIIQGVQYIHVESFLIFPFAAIFIFISLLQGIKAPGFIAYISAARQIILPVIFIELAMLFSQNLLMVWLSIALSVMTAAFIITLYANSKLRAVIAQHRQGE